MHRALLSSTYLRNVPDVAGGAAAPAPVVDVVVAAAPAAVVEPSPAAAAPEPAPAPALGGAEPVKADAAVGEPAAAAAPGPHDTPTLLEQVAAPGETAAEAAKPAEVAKPADAAAAAPVVDPAAAVAAAPVYEFKFPEGVKPDTELLGKVTEVFKGANIAPEIAQSLMDQHVSALQAYDAHRTEQANQAWTDVRKSWRDKVLADEQIGGSGHQTAMQAVARMRDLLVPAADKAEFDNFLRITGAGDHPQFLKIMHSFSRWLDEPAPLSTSGQPAPTNGQNPASKRGLKSIYQRGREERAANAAT